MALIIGTNGNDPNLEGFASNDEIRGLNGNDRLLGRAGQDWLRGGNGNDTLLGDAGDDKLDGDAGNDTLDGGLGADLLRGGSGRDTLKGGTGNDWINGGAGADVLDGGDNAVVSGVVQDVFDFNSVNDSRVGARDRIVNFNFHQMFADEGDKVDVSTIDADVWTPGNQDFVLGFNLWTLDLANSDTLIQGDVNGDFIADFEIAVADGGAGASSWFEADFVL